MKVYLAGPIFKQSDEQANDWRQDATKILKGLAIPTIDPMRRDYRGKEDEAARQIVEVDKCDVASCDILLAHMVPSISVGTTMEVLYAWERGKYVVVVAMPPVSPWLKYHAHYLCQSLPAALSHIQEYVRG